MPLGKEWMPRFGKQTESLKDILFGDIDLVKGESFGFFAKPGKDLLKKKKRFLVF